MTELTHKKILVIGSASKMLVTFRLDFLKTLQDKGFTVIATASRDDFFDQAQKTLQQHGILLCPVNLNNRSYHPFKDLVLIKELNLILKEHRPDIVFAYTLKPVLYGGLLTLCTTQAKLFTLISGRGGLYIYNTWKHKILRSLLHPFLRKVFSQSAGVLFQNTQDQELWTRLYALAPQKTLRVYGSGVNLDRFKQTPLPPLPPFKFLFVGRLMKEKGLEPYLEATKALKKTHPTVECHLAGGFPENTPPQRQDEILLKIQESGAHYHGEVLSPQDLLKTCHCFVLPSTTPEGLPRATLEALAVGRPVITTTVPGCSDTVIEGLNGYLVPPDHPQALYDAMVRLIENEKGLEKMAQQSHTLAIEHFNVEKVNQQTIDFICARL